MEEDNKGGGAGTAPAGDPSFAVSHAVKSTHRHQYAALPFRRTLEGSVEVMLITSRNTRRWIIPKGWPMGDRPPHKVAAQEAEEEAGIEGRVAKKPLGFYHYDKMLSNGTFVRCRVDVFALDVKKQKSTWPERKHRERRWLSLDEAVQIAGDVELKPLIRAFVPPTKK